MPSLFLSAHLSVHFIVVLLKCIQPAYSDPESISIMSADGVTNLRPCITPCYIRYGNDEFFNGDLLDFLDCKINQCMCRPDLQSSAHSYISGCIMTRQCSSNTFDLAAGLSFFDAYCSTYHLAVPPPTQAVQPTSTQAPVTVTAMPSSLPTTVVQTVTVKSSSTSVNLESSPNPSSAAPATPDSPTTSPPTFSISKSSTPSMVFPSTSSTSSSSSNVSGGGGGGSLGPGEIIGIVIGIVTLIVMVAIALWQVKKMTPAHGSGVNRANSYGSGG